MHCLSGSSHESLGVRRRVRRSRRISLMKKRTVVSVPATSSSEEGAQNLGAGVGRHVLPLQPRRDWSKLFGVGEGALLASRAEAAEEKRAWRSISSRGYLWKCRRRFPSLVNVDAVGSCAAAALEVEPACRSQFSAGARRLLPDGKLTGKHDYEDSQPSSLQSQEADIEMNGLYRQRRGGPNSHLSLGGEG